MEKAAFAIVALACPVGMGLMGWMMVKGMRRGDGHDDTDSADLDTLREEHRRLGADIDRLEAGERSTVAGTGR